MTVEYYSNLALVSSAAVYTLATVVHAAEWANARTSAAAPSPSVTEAPVPARSLVTLGGPQTLEAAPPVLAEAGLRHDEEAGASTRSDDDASGRVDVLGRAGVALTVLAFALNLGGVVLRGVAAGRAPWGNMLEFVTTAMVAVVGTYLLLVWRRRARWLGLPVAALAALANGLAVTVFYVAIAPLVPALHSVWFLIHIMAATISAAAFNLGALTALLYLIKTRRDRRVSRSAAPARATYLNRLPDARSLDRMSYRFHAFAFPLWTFTVAAGAVWAQFAWGRYWGWDPKETWALVTWVVYACYLHARSTAGWKGRRAAVLALVGVATFWFNFVGINLLVSGLHSYAGV